VLIVLVAVGVCVGGLAACRPAGTDDVIRGDYREPAGIAAAAVTAYGNEQAMDAYEELTDYLERDAYAAELINPPARRPDADELTGPLADRLTPDGRAGWDALVGQALAGDGEAEESVRLLRYYDWTIGDPDRVSPPGPPEGHVFRDAEVDLGAADSTGARPLSVSLRQSTRFALRSARSPYPVLIEKDLTVLMYPASLFTTRSPSASAVPSVGGRPDWLIDSFEGELTVTTPDTGRQPTPRGE